MADFPRHDDIHSMRGEHSFHDKSFAREYCLEIDAIIADRTNQTEFPVMRSSLVLVLAILAFPLAAAVADEAEDRKAVIAVVDAFFAGMTAKDVESMRKIMTEDGMLYGYRETAEGLTVFNPTHSSYLDSLAARESVPIERYWDPTVMLHERLAVVWTPYDFYSDGFFSHCGVNSFSMLKTDDGWKITGIVFSMEPEGCEPSPLGPLQAEQ